MLYTTALPILFNPESPRSHLQLNLIDYWHNLFSKNDEMVV